MGRSFSMWKIATRRNSTSVSWVVRTLGPKGFEKKFYLGLDLQLAEQKEKAIITIWQQIEERARNQKKSPTWDEGSLAAARAIEKGETPKIQKRDYEWPEHYFQRVNQLAGATGLPVEPHDPEWYNLAVPEVRAEIARLEGTIAVPGKPKATGQMLHQALKTYQDYILQEYLETDGHRSDRP